MSKQPQRKHCKTCQTLIPIAEWDEHKRLHDDQLDMFPDMPKQQVERVRRRRKVEA